MTVPVSIAILSPYCYDTGTLFMPAFMAATGTGLHLFLVGVCTSHRYDACYFFCRYQYRWQYKISLCWKVVPGTATACVSFPTSFIVTGIDTESAASIQHRYGTGTGTGTGTRFVVFTFASSGRGTGTVPVPAKSKRIPHRCRHRCLCIGVRIPRCYRHRY